MAAAARAAPSPHSSCAEMKYATLASTGAKIPMVGLGLGFWESHDVYQIVKDAIQMGYRHLDGAAFYGNEEEVGRALQHCIEAGVVTREEMWITSKLWNTHHRAADVAPALQHTLQNLQLEYVDLYLMHWPVVLHKDAVYPVAADKLQSLQDVTLLETWKAMENCVQQGWASHIGVANFSIVKVQHLLGSCHIPPAVNQVELHPYLQQDALLQYCTQHNIQVTAYSPLGSNDRPAFLRNPDDEPPTSLLQHKLFAEMAAKRSPTATPAQMILLWALQRGTLVIPKSSKRSHLQQNLQAGSSTIQALTEEEMSQIRDLDCHYRYFDGQVWTTPGSPYTCANLWDEEAEEGGQEGDNDDNNNNDDDNILHDGHKNNEEEPQ